MRQMIKLLKMIPFDWLDYPWLFLFFFLEIFHVWIKVPIFLLFSYYPKAILILSQTVNVRATGQGPNIVG